MDRPAGVLSAGWFRFTLLVVVLGILFAVSLPLLAKWTMPSQVMVLGPGPSQPLAAPAIQFPTPVVLSSSPAFEEAPPAARREDLPRTPPAIRSSATPAPEAGSKEGEDRFRIQVAAFTDSHHAERLESRLRAAHLPVYRTTRPRALTLYQLRVNPDGRATDLAKRLRDLGLSLGTVPGEDGALPVDPPLPMKRAADLSERLKADGVEVELRRIDRKAVVHVVRVGEYPSAAAAAEALTDLKDRGYDGVIVRE